MTVPLAIAYVLVTCLFLLIGYTTTPRPRLRPGLFILASLLWPLSLLLVAGYVVAGRIAGRIAGGDDGKAAVGGRSLACSTAHRPGEVTVEHVAARTDSVRAGQRPPISAGNAEVR